MAKLIPQKITPPPSDQTPAQDFRSAARQLTVQFLHQLAVQGDDIFIQLDRFLYEYSDQENTKDLARKWTKGTWQQREDIDRLIQKNSSHWDIKRISLVDHNNLRLAVYHLLYCPDIPPKVIINEAVELAKMFSTEQAPSFINGVLDSIRREIVNKNQKSPEEG
jgi:transcription antitermination factor NusB